MALALTNLAVNRDPMSVWNPADHKTIADVATSLVAQTTSVPFVQIRMVLYIKSYTEGTGTVGPIFQLIDSNNVILGQIQAARVTQPQCLILEGQVPVLMSTSYQIGLTVLGTDTLMYDVMVDVR